MAASARKVSLALCKSATSLASMRSMAWAQLSARISKNSISAASRTRMPGKDSPMAPMVRAAPCIGRQMTDRSPRSWRSG